MMVCWKHPEYLQPRLVKSFLKRIHTPYLLAPLITASTQLKCLKSSLNSVFNNFNSSQATLRSKSKRLKSVSICSKLVYEGFIICFYCLWLVLREKFRTYFFYDNGIYKSSF